MLVGRDRKKLTLQNGESMTLAVNSANANVVSYFAKFTGSGGGGGSFSFDSGLIRIEQYTFSAKAVFNDGDILIIYDEDNQGWGFWANVTGGGTEPNPGDDTDWDLLDSDHKVEVDLQGATTAQQVASEFRGARGSFSASPSFIDKFGVTAAVGGVWSSLANYPASGYTKDLQAAVSNSGGINIATTQSGTDGQVDPENDRLKIPGHGLLQDQEITLTEIGTLPSGLAEATPYYIGVVDADQIELWDVPGGGGSLIGIESYGTGSNELNYSGGGAVDASLLPRGSMTQQGQPNPQWHDASTTAIVADGFELETLSGWPFVQTQIVITNNGSDPLEVDAGLVARK